jgi:hypothetical protein
MLSTKSLRLGFIGRSSRQNTHRQLCRSALIDGLLLLAAENDIHLGKKPLTNSDPVRDGKTWRNSSPSRSRIGVLFCLSISD